MSDFTSAAGWPHNGHLCSSSVDSTDTHTHTQQRINNAINTFTIDQVAAHITNVHTIATEYKQTQKY